MLRTFPDLFPELLQSVWGCRTVLPVSRLFPVLAVLNSCSNTVLSKLNISSEIKITPRSSLGFVVAFWLLTTDIFQTSFSIVTTFACTRRILCEKVADSI